MSDFWQETIHAAQQLRHELHRQPELGWQEWRTAETVRAHLSEWQIPWRRCADLGTIARINGPLNLPSKEASPPLHPHIALRADLDALPIEEKSGKPWQSERPGCMHACGHDGHTAALLATARWLKHHESQLKSPVTLVFQPAEEGGHGAARMIEDGALEGVDAIYGWHNWPALPFGHMLCPDGLVMCGNGIFEIHLKGRGGHASQPSNCADPVLAASAITVNLNQLVGLTLPATEPAVVSVTSIVAPSGPTVIPETAVLGGSIRVPNETARERINRKLTEVATATAAVYGVTCEVRCEVRYGATINHREQASTMRSVWQSLAAAEPGLSVGVGGDAPVMASEDFSYYLKECPGAFCLIGADDGPNNRHPCHSAFYDFNDRLLPLVTRLFAGLAGIAPLS